MKKVARYYLGEEGIGNFDADHIQVVRRRLNLTLKKYHRQLWTCSQMHGTG